LKNEGGVISSLDQQAIPAFQRRWRSRHDEDCLRSTPWGSESTEAWRAVLDDLIRRGLRRPELLIVDGASGLKNAIAAIWDGVPVQRCTVHKHRNLLAHAPERLHEEITADYNDMIYPATREEIEARRKAFIRKWRLKHRAVVDSLQEAGESKFGPLFNSGLPVMNTTTIMLLRVGASSVRHFRAGSRLQGRPAWAAAKGGGCAVLRRDGAVDRRRSLHVPQRWQ
jgi:hypothetical protein